MDRRFDNVNLPALSQDEQLSDRVKAIAKVIGAGSEQDSILSNIRHFHGNRETLPPPEMFA